MMKTNMILRLSALVMISCSLSACAGNSNGDFNSYEAVYGNDPSVYTNYDVPSVTIGNEMFFQKNNMMLSR